MKKTLTIFVTVLMIGVASNLNAQQLYGRWVVPTMVGTSSVASYQLTFSDTIERIQLPTEPFLGSVEYCYMSAGGYNENYDLQFYVVGETFCHGDNSFDWADPPLGPAKLKPEYQIIQKPGIPDEYYSFFTHLDGSNLDSEISYNEISIEDNQVNVSGDFFLRGGLDGYVAFAITPEDTSPRYLYVSTGRNTASPPNNVAGIRKWTITSDGMEDETIIVSETTHADFDEYDFDAYNLELKIDDNNKTVIAYIHGAENTNPAYNLIVTEIIVVNAEYPHNPQKFELDKGRIAGIEFSTFEDNMLYASCEDGIVKVNYTNGQIVETVFSGDFQRTFLQTAPDGNIYGVSNDGHSLGRILQVGNNAGTFEHEDVFTFPILETVSTFRVFDDLKYFILPENSNTYVPLEAEAFPVDVSCPGYSDGEVTIYPTGGVPFDAPDDPYIIECDPSVSFTWDEDEGYFKADHLAEGIYHYTITDSYENTFADEFIIDVDYSDYTYLEHETFGEENIEWNGDVISFAKGFTISNGIKITVINSTLLFGELASVIIEPGSELIVDNSTLTHHAACNKPWQGIQVCGNRNKSQFADPFSGKIHQGKIEIKNNSYIKNAWNAVSNRRAGYYHSSGGIILARNSTFENNKRSVEFLSYENCSPYNHDIKLPYMSGFKNCTFVINDEYILPDMYAHVSMWDVYGIDFRGCVFSNNKTGAQHTGHGIFSLGAGYRLMNHCSSNLVQPCPEEDIVHCVFNNLYKGIHATNSIGCNNTIFVSNAEFINNSIGVYISAVNNAVVIDSDFEVGYNHIDLPSCGYSIGYGIDIHNSIGFAIEQNTFSKYTGGLPGYYIGIRVYECLSESDDIYRNEFIGLSIGNQAEKYNRSDPLDDHTGVAYLCNQNTANDYDFYVANLSTIRGYMGSDEIPSGNTLTDPAIAVVQFQNDYTQDIRYYYNVDETDEWLVEYSDYVYAFEVNAENTCPSHYGGGGQIKLTVAQKQQKESVYAQNLADYNNVKVLYNDMKDGGSTSAELSDIQTATPDDMWALRTQLLGDSPHLSQEVLKEMSDRTDVFPDATLLEILSANPEELREEELISYLENKEDPLPDYMIAILQQVANGSSYKSVLQNQMANYHHTYVNAAQDIIRSIQHDSITNLAEMRLWLDNISGYEMDKQIIATYLQEGDFTSTQSLLDMLPGLYDLADDELLAYNNYKTMVELQINLAQQNRNIHQLTAGELATVTNLADNGLGGAKYSARSILEYAYNQHYFDCPLLPESIGLKTVVPLDPKQWAKAMGLELSVDPNPASIWVAFDYQLPVAETEGVLSITDVNGRLITTIKLFKQQGQHVWDIREVKPGLYICTIKAGDMSISKKLIIK